MSGRIRQAVVGTAVIVGVVLAGPATAEAQQVTRCDAGNPSFSRTTLAPRYEIGPQENHEIASPVDGAAIEISVFRPQGVPAGEEIPVVLNATPYHHAQKTLDVRSCKPYFVENFVPQGYAVAFVPVRGTGDSGGCMNLMGPAERKDLDAAVTWLGTRDWSSGKVAMIGKSYEGSTPWMVAAEGNRHLKTIVSMAGVPDIFELMYGSGNIDFRGPAVLNDLYYAPSVVTYADGRQPDRTVDATACPEYATGSAAALESSVTGLEDGFGYWAERRYTDQVLERWKGSVLLTQGFADLNVPPSVNYDWMLRLRESKSITQLKQWWGHFAHSNPDQAGGAARRTDWPDVVLRWFDRHLRGNDAADTGPAVDIQDSTGAWRAEEHWPPKKPVLRRLWLGADGTLREGASGGLPGSSVLVPDPTHVQAGTVGSELQQASCPVPVCSLFTLGASGDRLHFTGRPELRLSVTPAAAAGHVTAFVYAVNDAGAARRIGWGQADIRFPEGDGVPRPVTPGTPISLRLALQPTDSVVPAGSKLVLVLSQGAAYDRIPSVPTAPLVLGTGGTASSMTLPLVPAD